MRTLILLIAVVLALYLIRYFVRRSGINPKQLYRKLALYGLAVVFVLLLVTGRLHWVFAAVAAALPFLFRLLPLIRYVPFLRSLYQRYQASQSGAQNPGTAQTSSVQSRYLRMILQHDTGEMDGEILLGPHKGKYLHEFSVQQLVQLLSDFSDDQDSLALLQTYLDRVHSDWRDHASGVHNETSAKPGQMNQQEAYEILGLQSGASEQQIVDAHRRLMQKMHPDRGGSDYLAAKINMAKDFLLSK